MHAPHPFYREAGSGTGVVCLHSNSSSSGQWRGLIEQLAPRFHVCAVDAWGSGRSPAWPGERALTLSDEVALLEPVLDRVSQRFVLVGHSYGGAVALMAALAHPDRVRALVLYEPTLFAVVDEESAPPNDADGIRATVAAAAVALAGGDRARAAEHFIDYWTGPGAWAAMPAARQASIIESIELLPAWAGALLGERTPAAAFAAIDVPVLYMTGGRSPVSSLAVARRLTRVLPRVERIDFGRLGHMGPVTDPAVVNDAIVRFIDRL